MIDLRKFNKRMARTPWMALSLPLGTLGTQIEKPAATGCFIFAALFAMLYGLYHWKERKDDKTN